MAQISAYGGSHMLGFLGPWSFCAVAGGSQMPPGFFCSVRLNPPEPREQRSDSSSSEFTGIYCDRRSIFTVPSGENWPDSTRPRLFASPCVTFCILGGAGVCGLGKQQGST